MADDIIGFEFLGQSARVRARVNRFTVDFSQTHGGKWLRLAKVEGDFRGVVQIERLDCVVCCG